MEAIDRLIAETFEWLAFHKRRHSNIEMLACAIRLKALQDAKRALSEADKPG